MQAMPQEKNLHVKVTTLADLDGVASEIQLSVAIPIGWRHFKIQLNHSTRNHFGSEQEWIKACIAEVEDEIVADLLANGVEGVL